MVRRARSSESTVMATDVLAVVAAEWRILQQAQREMDAMTLHEKLVAHVRAVSGEEESRAGVWGEHSYARAPGPPASPMLRVLLAPAEPAPPAAPDVLAEPRAPPALPADRADRADSADSDHEEAAPAEEHDEEWEERLCASAPGAAHARLAAAAVGVLRALRLERAAGARGRWARREAAVGASRRLRRALAPHWPNAAAWLLAALPARLPPDLRPLYAETLGELRRAAPRLAERLPPQPPPPADPLDALGEPVGPEAPGPWLAWAPSGCAALDRRWTRRLRALLHTRELASPPATARPDRWCAALAADSRLALHELLASAGRRAVVLAGAGAGAALAAWLVAGSAGARALLLLAPPLVTAEGARDRPEELPEEAAVPMLAVVGGGGARSWRGAACELAARGGGRAARRVLLVGGADDALRVPRALRRRLRLPQAALDAAVTEECVRWAADAVETSRATGAADDAASGAGRAVDVVEGRVVSRGPGGSPLALLPPRRIEPAGARAEPALGAADIMQLPIVFADDARPPADEAAPRRPPAALHYTRVIVAKRAPRPVLLRRRGAPPP